MRTPPFPFSLEGDSGVVPFACPHCQANRIVCTGVEISHRMAPGASQGIEIYAVLPQQAVTVHANVLMPDRIREGELTLHFNCRECSAYSRIEFQYGDAPN